MNCNIRLDQEVRQQTARVGYEIWAIYVYWRGWLDRDDGPAALCGKKYRAYYINGIHYALPQYKQAVEQYKNAQVR